MVVYFEVKVSIEVLESVERHFGKVFGYVRAIGFRLLMICDDGHQAYECSIQSFHIFVYSLIV